MSKDFDDLLKGFIEGSLSKSDQLRLEETLKSDSAARQRYLDYMAVESILGSHKVKIENSVSINSKSKLKLSTNKFKTVKKRASSKSKSSSAFLILAASLFLALGLAYYMKFLKPKDEVANVEPKAQTKILSVSGDVSIIFNGRSSKAANGQELLSGSKLSSSQSGQVIIETVDGSKIKLAPSSMLELHHIDDQYMLTLDDGFLNMDVNKQPAGKPMIISSKDTQMTVLGTVLRIGSDEDTTTLTVDEGAVEIKNAQNQAVVIKSHETAKAQIGKAMEVKNLSAYKVDKLEIINALYGAEDKWVDLTKQVQVRAGNNRLIPTGAFKTLAGDPNYGIVKSLKITYKIDGKLGSHIVKEYTGEVVDTKYFTKEVILPEL